MISPPSPRQTTFIRIIAFEYHSHSRIEREEGIGEKEKKKKKEKKEEEGVALTTREEIVSSSNWMHSQNELRGALSHYPFSSQISEFFVSSPSFQFFFPFPPPSSIPPQHLPTLDRASPRSTASCRFVSLPGLAWNRAWILKPPLNYHPFKS